MVSRSFVLMNPRRNSFFDLASISPSRRRPAALVSFAISITSGVGQELSLVVQSDGSAGRREARLLHNRAGSRARTDDVTQGVDDEEALRLNLVAVDRGTEPLDDAVTLESVSDAVSSLEIHELVGRATRWCHYKDSRNSSGSVASHRCLSICGGVVHVANDITGLEGVGLAERW